jgi:ABC-2 type transport system permease protein
VSTSTASRTGLELSSAAAVTGALPSPIRVGLARGKVELRSFFRQRTGVIFVFALPAVLLTLFGSIFSKTYPAPGISEGQFMVGGLVAAGLASTAFLNIGTGIAQDREDGTLKRLRGMPVLATSYILGKLVLVLVTTVAEVTLLMAVGRLFYDVKLPRDFAHWWTLGWVFMLGTTACLLLGIAASALAPDARSAPAILNLIFIVLEFTSGVFIVPITTLPNWMVTASSFLPLKWVAQGMRSVFLPDSVAHLEQAGSWEPGRTALALAAWCVVGLLLCLLTFKWTDRAKG